MQSTALNHLHHITSVPEAKLSIKMDLYWAGPVNFMPVVKELASSAVWSFMFNLKDPVIQTGLGYQQSFTEKKNLSLVLSVSPTAFLKAFLMGKCEEQRTGFVFQSSPHKISPNNVYLQCHAVFAFMRSMLPYPMFICCGFWMLCPLF